MDGSQQEWSEGPRAPAGRMPALLVADAAHPMRGAVEDFIAASYAQAYAARVSQFLPMLLALAGPQGEIEGAVGVRFAGHGPLFVERYLDAPVESVLAQHYALPVARSRTVEIGHLCGLGGGTGPRLFPLLARWLQDAGAQWAVFAATSGLRRQFARLGLAPRALAPALAARLGAGAAAWGRYYETDPWVLGGPVALASRLGESLR